MGWRAWACRGSHGREVVEAVEAVERVWWKLANWRRGKHAEHEGDLVLREC